MSSPIVRTRNYVYINGDNFRPRANNPPADQTISSRTDQRIALTNPLQLSSPSQLQTLTPAQRKTWTHTNLIIPVSQDKVPLGNKTEREFWKAVTKEQLPIRRLPKTYNWGKDKSGRDLGEYTVKDFEQRTRKQTKLTALSLRSRRFKLDRARGKLEENSVEEEKKRRGEMADLRKDLYGETTGSLAQDPEWDDVIPVPQNESEDALAKIAYPDDYAEGTPPLPLR